MVSVITASKLVAAGNGGLSEVEEEEELGRSSSSAAASAADVGTAGVAADVTMDSPTPTKRRRKSGQRGPTHETRRGAAFYASKELRGAGDSGGKGM